MFVFLFSDIDGSTARWEARPQAMADAVHRHDGILSRVVGARDGRVFKTVGDAFCVVFSSAQSAVRAAIEVQRTLEAENWDAVGGLPVRIALHVGEAIERDGDFFGPPLNRAARLVATAHGRQIIASGAVADLVGDALPQGVSLRPLGTFHLKDLEQPERIYQILAPDLPSEFKALNTLDAIPNNLPVQSGTFVGRQSDLTNIRSAMRESSVTTIAGPAGVGKTRVALACAVDAMDRFADGVWFANLAPLSDPSLVTTTALAAVGAGGSGASDPLEALLEHLRNKRALVVLDNCEHVIHEAAKLAAAVRTRCRHVTILATTRAALRVEGERVYRLDPLPLDDAVELFLQRSPQRPGENAGTPEHLRIAREICERLDGIPLAVELAAARTSSLSASEILRRLSERFRLLTAGSRAAAQRQQTLHAAIDWSYGLLSEDQQRLLERISVFRGMFSLEALAGVCCDDALDEWQALDAIAALVESSLTVADVGSVQQRYRLLETIREYGLAKLRQAGMHDEFRKRHARYYADTIHRLQTEFEKHPPADWIDRIMPDLENFRAALDFSTDDTAGSQRAQMTVDFAPTYLRLSLLGEGIDRCTRALELPDVALPLQARLNDALSTLCYNKAEYNTALLHAQQAAAMFENIGDARGTARALSRTAACSSKLGDFEAAKDTATRAMAAARSVADVRVVAMVARRCASAFPPTEIETARELFAEAMRALETERDEREAVRVREWWAEAEACAGFFARASTLALQALKTADDEALPYLHCNLAAYALALGDAHDAYRHVKEAMPRAIETRHPIIMAILIAFSAVNDAIDAASAARLLGYARRRLNELAWNAISPERLAMERVEQIVRGRVGNAAADGLLAEGAAWSEDEALRDAVPAFTSL